MLIKLSVVHLLWNESCSAVAFSEAAALRRKQILWLSHRLVTVGTTLACGQNESVWAPPSKTWRELSFALRDSEVRVDLSYAKLHLAKGKHPKRAMLDQTEVCFPDLVSHRIFLVAFHLSGNSPQVFFSFMLQEKTPQVMDTGSHGSFDVKLDTLPKTNVHVDSVLTYFSRDPI